MPEREVMTKVRRLKIMSTVMMVRAGEEKGLETVRKIVATIYVAAP